MIIENFYPVEKVLLTKVISWYIHGSERLCRVGYNLFKNYALIGWASTSPLASSIRFQKAITAVFFFFRLTNFLICS